MRLLQYDKFQYRNIAVLTQHSPAALSLPSSPKRRPDHFTTSLSWVRRGRAGGRFVSVSPPLASSVLSSKVSEFTRAPGSWAAMGLGGREETGKASKNSGGSNLLGLQMSRGTGSVKERCHTCHGLRFPQKRFIALWYQKKYQCHKRFTSYCPPLIQNTLNFCEQLLRHLQSLFNRTRPLMFTKLCVFLHRTSWLLRDYILVGCGSLLPLQNL